MVKTIFYFCPTEEEYNSLKDNAELSTHTIVFVEDTRAIYLNGRRYGQGAGYVTEEEFNTEKDVANVKFARLNTQIEQVTEQIERHLDTTRIQLEDSIEIIRNLVLDAESDISQVSDDLDEFKETIREEVDQDITEAVTDSNGKNVWTRISEADNGIERIYNKIDEITDEDGNIKYTEALQNVISTGIANDASFNELQNRWAVVDENENVLKWMATGFTSVAQDGQSFASVFATLVDDSMPGYKSAISNLRTRVIELENADYVATADLQTQVESLLGTTLSSLALKSDVTEAYTTLSSSINNISQWEDDLDERLAAVTTKANNNETLVTSWATFGENQSIVYNKSKIDEAIAGLFVQGSPYTSTTNVSNIATALILALVKGDQSWINLTADQINLNGDVIAQRLTTANASIGGWTIDTNKLYTEFHSGGRNTEAEIGSGYLDFKFWQGNGTFDVPGNHLMLSRVELNQNGLLSWSGNVGDGSEDPAPYGGITIHPQYGFGVFTGDAANHPAEDIADEYSEIVDGTNCTSFFDIDGSGSLGRGGITWDANGVFNISQIGTFSASGEDEFENVTETNITNGQLSVNTTTPNDEEFGVSISSGFIRLTAPEGNGHLSANELSVTSEDNNGTTTITGGNVNTHNITAGGSVEAGSFSVGGTAGYTGSIVIGSQTITVTGGIITGVTNGAA